MEGKKSEFNPINYIINPQILQQYECLICLQRSISLLRCKSCHISFCNQCATDVIKKTNKCPQRCTNDPIKLQLIHDLHLSFRCPFSADCKEVLKSQKMFAEHDRVCRYISPLQREQQNKKWKFKCKKDHDFEIYLVTNLNLIKRVQCAQCSNISTSRVLCRKFDELYCRFCRPVPIINFKCLIGHTLANRNIESPHYQCDICELSPVILGEKIYDDSVCNFCICERCIDLLPKFQKPIQYHENMRHYCKLVGVTGKNVDQKLHRLVMVRDIKKRKCAWCQKQKECIKKCEECSQYYCFDCKQLQILQNCECEYGHMFKQLQVHSQSKKQYGQQQQDKQVQQLEQNEIKERQVCDRCGEQSNQKRVVMADNVCKLLICKQCIKQLRQYQFDVLQRQKQIKMPSCPYKADHLNMFYTLHREIPNQLCSLCGQKRIIKIICEMCQQIRFYCCQCLPPPNPSHCYCLKQLQQKTDSPLIECLICSQVAGTPVYGCAPCGYYICQSCYKGSIEKQDYEKLVQETMGSSDKAAMQQ